MTHFLLGQEKLRTHRNILFCYKYFPVMHSRRVPQLHRGVGYCLTSTALAFAAGPSNDRLWMLLNRTGENARLESSTDLLGEPTFPSTFHPLRQKHRYLAYL